MRVTFRAEERERVRRNDGSVESRVEVIASGRGFDGVVVFSAWLFLSNPDARRAFTLALAQRLVDIEAYAGKYVSHDMMMLVAEDQRVEEQLAGLIHSA